MRQISIIILSIMIFTIHSHAFTPDEMEKSAILMVHFGTTFDDTRSATIDAINKKVIDEFPQMKVTEAFTSRIVISRLAKRGINKPTPTQALLQLAADGYTHIFIQSTNVIDGVEMESLRNEINYLVPFFKEVRIGYPLLYSIDDCLAVENILADRYYDKAGKESAVVLVGHGTSTPATAIYSQMDYMFTSEGNPSFHVATVEGYPTFETTLSRLKTEKIKNVTLIPFMFVAGDHARNDIDKEWRELFEAEGFIVNTIIEGLGEIPQIQEIYINHIRNGLRERLLSPVERKAAFLKENLK